MLRSTLTISLLIALTMHGCAIRSQPIALSEYLGPHTGVQDEAVRICAVGVRAPRPQDLVVDLALEGTMDDVGWVAHLLWFAYQRGEQDWICVVGPSGRQFRLWTYKRFHPPLQRFIPTGPSSPQLVGISVHDTDSSGEHVRAMLTLKLNVPVLYLPQGGEYMVELHADQITSLDYVSRRQYEIAEGVTRVELRRGTVASDVPYVSFYPLRSGATAEDRQRLIERLQEAAKQEAASLPHDAR